MCIQKKNPKQKNTYNINDPVIGDPHTSKDCCFTMFRQTPFAAAGAVLLNASLMETLPRDLESAIRLTAHGFRLSYLVKDLDREMIGACLQPLVPSSNAPHDGEKRVFVNQPFPYTCSMGYEPVEQNLYVMFSIRSLFAVLDGRSKKLKTMSLKYVPVQKACVLVED